ncbi:Rho-associated protein kinase 2 [Boothiomyces sp. JEL0866]|nr:Rho-associated protein kinase 2 [Boothiomyces sp. JEL0866]
MANLNDTFPSIMKERLLELSDYISTEENSPPLSLETLLDIFVAVYTDCKAATNQNDQITTFISRYNSVVGKIQSFRVNMKDFETIKTLATGAVGRVCLVRCKKNKQVYAMKILKKQDLLTRQEAAFFMEERNALVFSQKSRWITTLYAAFQDDENLYLVMEYVCGGSMRALMNNRETVFTEEEARFYIAEMILSLEEIHNHHYIHRDVKPENYLLDSQGHIKLADFGSCIRLSDKDSITSHETVGTPDYISPEILKANEGNVNYGIGVDWWSIGIILYEMLCDEVPFYSESLAGTYGRIMNHEKYFAFPDDVELSDTVKDLISRLICKQEVRIGQNGAKEIMNHKWFEGINWENIRNQKAPFIPELSGPEDTRYFEDEDNESKKFAQKPISKTKEFSGKNLAFIGYNYVHNSTAMIVYPGVNESATTSAPKKTEPKPIQIVENKETFEKLGAAEQELKSLQTKLALELENKAIVENTLNTLQKEKIKLETEIKQLKSTCDRALAENTNLAEKLSKSQLKETESALQMNNLNELTEARSRLEKELAKAISDLKAQKEEVLKVEILHNETSKLNANLELKIKELQDVIKAKQSDNESLSQKCTLAGITILERKQEVADLKNRLFKLNSELEQLTQVSQEHLQEQVEIINEQNDRITELEKNEVLLKMENDSFANRIEGLEEEREKFSLQLAEARNSSNQTTNEEIVKLKSDMEATIQSKNKLVEELSQQNKTKALLELENNSLRKALDTAEKSKASAESKLSSLEQKLTDNSEIIQKLQSEKEITEHNLQNLTQSFNEFKESHKNIENTNTNLLETIAKLESENNTFRRDIEQLNGKLKVEMEHYSDTLNKLQANEEALSNERKLKVTKESENAILEEKISLLTSSNRQYVSQIENYDQMVNGLHEEILHLKTQEKILLINMSTAKDAFDKQIEEIKAETESTIHQYAQRAKEEATQRLKVEEQLNNNNQQIMKLVMESSQAKNQVSELQDRISELEGEIERVDSFKRTDSTDILREQTHKSKEYRPLEKGDKDKSSRTGLNRLSGMFFRSKESLNDDKKLHEEDEKSNDHVRNKSHQSIQSLESAKLQSPNILKNPQLTVLDFFNPMDGLDGWIKVPKGGKVKKGWKKQYLVFMEDKLFTFETKVQYNEAPNSGAFVCDLSCEIFVARTVSQNEVIHANARDIDLIFKIQAANTITSDNQEGLHAERLQRITQLKESIAVEENMRNAGSKMLELITDAQKVTVINQIDASNRRIRTLNMELEKLLEEESGVDTHSHANAAESLRKELAAQLEDEVKKREALSKLAVGDKKKKHNSEQAKAIEVEILTSDRIIAKIKENVEILDSKNPAKIKELIVKMGQNISGTDTKGHVFSQRQYFKPTDCGICNEPLWDTKNVGFECTSCKLICHKNCRAQLDISCQNQGKLKNIPPLYFMAESIQDRARWLAGLAYYRKDIEVRSTTTTTPTMKRLKTYVEPANSIRMSAAFVIDPKRHS